MNRLNDGRWIPGCLSGVKGRSQTVSRARRSDGFDNRLNQGCFVLNPLLKEEIWNENHYF
jgi:hypothetical protein